MPKLKAPKKMKQPRVKKPKVRSQPKVKVSQKQNINIRINNGSGGPLQQRLTENTRTVPITTYPLFREQFDQAPINRNIMTEKVPVKEVVKPVVESEAEKDIPVSSTPKIKERVAVPIKIPTPLPRENPVKPERGPFTSPSQGELKSPTGELYFRNIYKGGESNFKYSREYALSDDEKSSENPLIRDTIPKPRAKRPPRTEAQKERRKELNQLNKKR